MKRYAKLVQCDERGQIVIPKDVRSELNIEGGTGFYLYVIENEGILLKPIPIKELDENKNLVQELSKNADKIKLNKKNVEAAVKKYKRVQKNFQKI